MPIGDSDFDGANSAHQQFVDLSADKSLMQAVLARLNLIESDEHIRVEPLAGGVSSTIVRIESKNGTFCLKQALPLLKVNTTWSAPVTRVYAEIAWLNLARIIVPGSSPQVFGVDRLTNSFVMTYLPPERFANWKAELMSGRVDVGFTARVGGTLARIHSRTAHDDEVRRMFSNDDHFLALRLDPYLLEVARRHPGLAVPLRRRAQEIQSVKLALVHGDMSPKNILIGPDGPVFLDAECACYGDPAFDAAFCLNHLLLKSLAVRDHCVPLLQAFEEFAEEYLSNATWEPRDELETRIAGLLPMLLIARISGKSPVEYLNPVQRKVVFETAAPLVCRPLSRLREVELSWKRGINA